MKKNCLRLQQIGNNIDYNVVVIVDGQFAAYALKIDITCRKDGNW